LIYWELFARVKSQTVASWSSSQWYNHCTDATVGGKLVYDSANSSN